MTRFAGALVLVATAARVARADSGELRGVVIDKDSRQPVVGAIIMVGPELAASDEEGSFTVAVAPGVYTVRVAADWIVTAERTVTIRSGVATSLTVEVALNPAASGETIEVIDVAPTAPGESRVDAKLARSLPGGGDAARVVQSLPAVARPAAGTTDIVVWGAAPNETRVFVDGVPVRSLYHVGGYRSSVGNELIGDVRLTPAAFGADRGGAIGGVIDVSMIDPARTPRLAIQADLLDGSVQGRTKVGRATVAAALRQSWLDRAIALVGDPDRLAPNAPLPRWSDAQVVVRVPTSGSTVVSGWAMGSADVLDRTLSSSDPGTRTAETVDRTSVRAQLTLRRERRSGYDSATIWLGRDRGSDGLQVGPIQARVSSRENLAGARAAQQTRFGKGRIVTVGLDVDGARSRFERRGSLSIPAREGDVRIFGQPPGDDIAADRWTASTIDTAGHGVVDLARGRVSGSVGLRVDTWLLEVSRQTPRIGATPGIGWQSIDMSADPRAAVQVRLTEALIIRADAGRYHQARAASDTSAVFGTPTLELESAWHLIVGTQWRRRQIAVEAAAYARRLDDLVARDLAVTPPLAHSLTQSGVGHVEGVQVTARVSDWRGLSGWLSYNVSRSRRQDAANEAWRYFDHDQTHGLIAVVGWQRGPYTLGARLRVATGEPRTAVLGSFYDSRSGRFEPVRGPHNGSRLPAFFAADLRGERRLRLGSNRAAVYVEVQNLTNRANAEENIYSADFKQHGYLTGLPILGILGLRIER